MAAGRVCMYMVEAGRRGEGAREVECEQKNCNRRVRCK